MSSVSDPSISDRLAARFPAMAARPWYPPLSSPSSEEEDGLLPRGCGKEDVGLLAGGSEAVTDSMGKTLILLRRLLPVLP